jgi:hypothetical protein
LRSPVSACAIAPDPGEKTRRKNTHRPPRRSLVRAGDGGHAHLDQPEAVGQPVGQRQRAGRLVRDGDAHQSLVARLGQKPEHLEARDPEVPADLLLAQLADVIEPRHLHKIVAVARG